MIESIQMIATQAWLNWLVVSHEVFLVNVLPYFIKIIKYIFLIYKNQCIIKNGLTFILYLFEVLFYL
jgi:hypothetical protein